MFEEQGGGIFGTLHIPVGKIDPARNNGASYFLILPFIHK